MNHSCPFVLNRSVLYLMVLLAMNYYESIQSYLINKQNHLVPFRRPTVNVTALVLDLCFFFFLRHCSISSIDFTNVYPLLVPFTCESPQPYGFKNTQPLPSLGILTSTTMSSVWRISDNALFCPPAITAGLATFAVKPPISIVRLAGGGRSSQRRPADCERDLEIQQLLPI